MEWTAIQCDRVQRFEREGVQCAVTGLSPPHNTIRWTNSRRHATARNQTCFLPMHIYSASLLQSSAPLQSSYAWRECTRLWIKYFRAVSLCPPDIEAKDSNQATYGNPIRCYLFSPSQNKNKHKIFNNAAAALLYTAEILFVIWYRYIYTSWHNLNTVNVGCFSW